MKKIETKKNRRLKKKNQFLKFVEDYEENRYQEIKVRYNS